jgi:hypothetical protein
MNGKNSNHSLTHRVTESHFCRSVGIDAIHAKRIRFRMHIRETKEKKTKTITWQINLFMDFPSQGNIYDNRTTKVTRSDSMSE